MKLVMLMYLQEDDKCVAKLLKEQEVEAFNSMPMEGRGPGSNAGWYGETAPYQSRMVIAVLPDEQAQALVQAVAHCSSVEDPRHPIRAVQLDVEQFACCTMNS